jgi:hypothetical protein
MDEKPTSISKLQRLNDETLRQQRVDSSAVPCWQAGNRWMTKPTSISVLLAAQRQNPPALPIAEQDDHDGDQLPVALRNRHGELPKSTTLLYAPRAGNMLYSITGMVRERTCRPAKSGTPWRVAKLISNSNNPGLAKLMPTILAIRGPVQSI